MNKILVVEDDSRISLALATRLQASGFEVRTAPDPVTALQLARTGEFDLALLDIMMPAGGGIVLAERLRTLVPTAAIPIVFLTASKNPDLRAKASELGAAAFLEKPFDSRELLRIIHEALATRAT